MSATAGVTGGNASVQSWLHPASQAAQTSVMRNSRLMQFVGRIAEPPACAEMVPTGDSDLRSVVLAQFRIRPGPLRANGRPMARRWAQSRVLGYVFPLGAHVHTVMISCAGCFASSCIRTAPAESLCCAAASSITPHLHVGSSLLRAKSPAILRPSKSASRLRSAI